MANAKDYLIALCDGHGMETPGKRTPVFPDGTVMKENEFNRAVVKYLDEDLRRIGFKTLLVAPTDEDTPLENRVKKANDAKADIYVSVHANAYNGIWDATQGGIETYHYHTSVKGKQLAATFHKNLIQGTPLIDRGIKPANFFVLRETNMPAVLAECGFMDASNDAKHLRTEEYRKECAIEISRGICEYFGIVYPEEKEYLVNVTNILGLAMVTVGQAKAWAAARKATPLFVSLADLFWEIAPKLNVRPEVAYAQSAKETGFGWYKGTVDVNFHNTCGLKTSKGGANDDPNAHQRFPDWQTGILAHVQHLALYAGVDVVGEIVDPRHFTFVRGRAKTLEELGGQGKWAPNPAYGVSIVKDYLQSLMATPEPVQSVSEPASEEEKAMKRLMEAGIVFNPHDFTDPVKWGELAHTLCRILDKVQNV